MTTLILVSSSIFEILIGTFRSNLKITLLYLREISFDKNLGALWNFMPFVKKPFSFAYNLFNSKPHNAVLSSSSRKELEKFYEKDIADTRFFLEQKQISNFPEWMNR